MTTLQSLTDYCDQLLATADIQDYCPNGLQIDCSEQKRLHIQTLVAGVTASESLIRRAVELNADVLLVHHGYFWKGEAPVLTGMKYRRIRSLLEADIALLAYHLPLDVHQQYGNNACLADILGIDNPGSMAVDGVDNLFWFGEYPAPLASSELAARLTRGLDRAPQVLGPSRDIRRIGWCSGGAQQFLETAAALSLDAYVSGEASEQTTHIALESGVTYFAAGHHATERYGVQALGQHLAGKFGLDYQYVEIDNPV